MTAQTFKAWTAWSRCYLVEAVDPARRRGVSLLAAAVVEAAGGRGRHRGAEDAHVARAPHDLVHRHDTPRALFHLRGITRDCTPFPLIFQGMILLVQGMTLPSLLILQGRSLAFAFAPVTGSRSRSRSRLPPPQCPFASVEYHEP